MCAFLGGRGGRASVKSKLKYVMVISDSLFYTSTGNDSGFILPVFYQIKAILFSDWFEPNPPDKSYKKVC